MSTARHLNGVNASLPLEKGNTYHIILNIDASTFEPQLEFGFWDGNRKLYEYYVHKSDTVISYTFKPQETKTYRINLRMRQAGYEGEAQTFYVKSAAMHQYQVKVSQETKGGSSHIYDFHARQYAPALGRFWSVDPLADHPNQVDKSPYAAFWNNPIRYDDPDGMCPECKENVIDPTDGQSYTSTGGAEYIFGNGEWTRLDGILGEVTITAQKPSLLEKGYYRGQAAAQDAWNSPMARAYVPDFVSVSGGFTGIALVGGGTSLEANWVLRGPEASLPPAITTTQSVGGGYSIDATLNVGRANYLGPVNEINRGMLQTNVRDGQVTVWGSGGIVAGGKVGVTGSYTPITLTSGILGSQVNLGLGLPFGPLPGNGAGGVSNTYTLFDFYKKK